MKISFKRFQEHINSHQYRNRINVLCGKVLTRILDIIDEEDIKCYYPKYLFKDDKTLEIYIFTERCIIIGKTNDEDDVEIRILKKSNVIETSIIESGFNMQDIKLKIKFSSGNEIDFYNIDDTNNAHSMGFKEMIGDIIQDLI